MTTHYLIPAPLKPVLMWLSGTAFNLIYLGHLFCPMFFADRFSHTAGTSSPSSAFHLLKDQSNIYLTSKLFTRDADVLINFQSCSRLNQPINDAASLTPHYGKGFLPFKAKEAFWRQLLIQSSSSRSRGAYLLMRTGWIHSHSGRTVIQTVWKSLTGKTQLGRQYGACNKILSP